MISSFVMSLVLLQMFLGKSLDYFSIKTKTKIDLIDHSLKDFTPFITFKLHFLIRDYKIISPGKIKGRKCRHFIKAETFNFSRFQYSENCLNTTKQFLKENL